MVVLANSLGVAREHHPNVDRRRGGCLADESKLERDKMETHRLHFLWLGADSGRGDLDLWRAHRHGPQRAAALIVLWLQECFARRRSGLSIPVGVGHDLGVASHPLVIL
jgi:hypothetical protein